MKTVKDVYRILREKTLRGLFKCRQRDKKILNLVSGKNGLEIGGPSPIFQEGGFLPIYPLVHHLDGCNFAGSTLWEGKIQEGHNYRYGKEKAGYQYISDGTDLSRIPCGQYDFVLSCNNLEHIANPLKAIKEWLRVLKPGGHLLILVPRKETNFDHNRPTTSFDHLVSDYEKKLSEDDLTHLDEILSLHDLALDPPAGNLDTFKQRSLRNHENRALHHHVFDQNVLRNISTFFNLGAPMIDNISSDYIAAMQKN